MSLSPQDYSSATGVAVTDRCSILVYLTELKGVSPSGCVGCNKRALEKKL